MPYEEENCGEHPEKFLKIGTCRQNHLSSTELEMFPNKVCIFSMDFEYSTGYKFLFAGSSQHEKVPGASPMLVIRAECDRHRRQAGRGRDTITRCNRRESQFHNNSDVSIPKAEQTCITN